MFPSKEYFRAGFYAGLGFLTAGVVFAILYWLLAMTACAAILTAGSAAGRATKELGGTAARMNNGSGRSFRAEINASWTVQSIESAGYKVDPAGQNEYDLQFKDGTVHIITNNEGKITGSTFR